MSSNRRKVQVLQPVEINQSRLFGSDGFVRINRIKSKPDGKGDKLGKKNQKTAESFTGKTDQDLATQKCLPTAEDQPEGAVAAARSTAQTDPSADEIVSWMTDSEPPNTYWKELAEQRRIALAESLTENEELYKQIEIFEEKVEIIEKEKEILKAENETLKEAADEAVRLADLLKELLADNEQDDD